MIKKKQYFHLYTAPCGLKFVSIGVSSTGASAVVTK